MFGSLEQLHHAFLVVGNQEKNIEQIKNFLHGSNIEWNGNPDITLIQADRLGIDDVRPIVAMVQQKSIDEHRWVILAANWITNEAQNTLLKSLEDPFPGVHFFLVIPELDRVLGTIQSRCQIIQGDVSVAENRFDGKLFLAQSMAERFKLVESWTKNKKEEDNITKSEVIAMIDLFEKTFWKQGNRDEQMFADIRKMRDYVALTGASRRIILDFLGMILPVVK